MKYSTLVLILITLLSVNLAFGISNVCMFSKFWKDGNAYPSLLLIINGITIVGCYISQIVHINYSTQLQQIIEKNTVFILFLMFFTLLYWFLIDAPTYYKEGILIFFITTFFLLTIFQKIYINYLRKHVEELPISYVLLIGNSFIIDSLQENLKINNWLGYEVLEKFSSIPNDFSFLQTYSKKIQSIFIDIDSVILSKENEIALKNLVEIHAIQVYVISNVFSNKFSFSSYNLVNQIRYTRLFTFPLDSFIHYTTKRIFDVFFSLFIVLFCISWLFPIIILLSILDSGFPVFYKQKRIGFKGKEFYCLKFRSMVENENEKTPNSTKKNDHRVTRFGKWMRKKNIDELPQFFNVILGDMSVVGPRPHMVVQDNYYAETINKYVLRHHVKPGITGLAQVNGLRGAIETPEDMEKRINMDISYIRNWNMFLDVHIIYRTVVNMIQGEKNAY